PELKKLDGVFGVDLSGGGSRQVVIKLDPSRLATEHVSVQQVVAALQANSLTIPGGTVDQQGFSIPVVTTHRFQSVQEICALAVGAAIPAAGPPAPSTPNMAGLCQPTAQQPGTIVLADVATVAQSDTPTDGIARTNGAPSVGIAVTKTQDANTVSVSD